MNDKEMVLDALTSLKHNLTMYQMIITESKNESYRKKMQAERDKLEEFQFELWKLAEQKGFYPTPKDATQEEVTTAKKALQAVA